MRRFELPSALHRRIVVASASVHSALVTSCFGRLPSPKTTHRVIFGSLPLGPELVRDCKKTVSSTHRFNYKSTGHRVMSCAFMVGVRRFELPASWSRTKRSTKLSHTPFYMSLFNALIFYHNLSSLSIVFFQKSRLIERRGNAYPKKSKKRKNGAQKSCNLLF